MSFQVVAKHLLLGMPPRLAVAAQLIADRGGVAVIGRALTFGEPGFRGLPQYVFQHAVASTPPVPLMSAHSGESGDPDGDDVAHQIGTCEDVALTGYGLDYLWKVNDNATAINRLRRAIAAGGAGLSLEDDQSRRVEWVDTDPRDPRGQARRVSSMALTGVALVDEPAFRGARVAAVLSERATYIYSPAGQCLWLRGGDSDGSALMELEERATAAGRIDPEMTQVATRKVNAEIYEVYRWKRNTSARKAQPHYIRGAEPYRNNRGERIEIGPVVPMGWTG
ncbi:hypothetical protein [Microbacterium jiangjiandongii]|uniref:hypothetical protein n=1 Tax=Microbacterium jiangjiandongii TaxID=3049071 RepID=UPI00214B5E7A|nr:hypothetical protein [Microbacterium sp. zg.Y843]MCR2814462.1 hypothetical protein [Microbacterium sp. zg.Y843]